MKSVRERIVDYLNDHKVRFEQIAHPAAGSVEEYRQTMGTRLEQQAKALFIRWKNQDSKGFAVAALQAQKKADLAVLCRLLGAKETRLGTLEQLKEVTGCSYGELPPFGKFFSLPLLMDTELLSEEKIFFNAGALDFSIVLNPAALVKLEEPIFF